MTPRGALLAVTIAPLLAGGCAHAPAARAPRAEVVWPAPPAAPRVRLASVFPDPDAPAPQRSFWSRALDLLVGREREAPERWLVRPFGVATAADGALYVADPDAPAVLRVAGATATRVACRDIEWRAPMAVAIAADQALYVADGAAAAIVVVRPGGACTALGAGSLERPVALVLDGARLLVADPPRHQIVVLSTAGEVLSRWGKLGEGQGELHFPTGLARAPDGTVLVVDALNFRVARFSAAGEWLGAFGAAGETAGDLARPKGIATDAAGAIYVTDAQRDLVLVYDARGTFEYAIGASGSAPGLLALPAGVAVDGRRLVVADSMNRRVQVFEFVGDRT